MYFKRFHRHNAYVSKDDGMMVFKSYATIIAVVKDGILYKNSRWYSSSTTRQLNRFIKEYDLGLLPLKNVSPERVDSIAYGGAVDDGTNGYYDYM